MRNKIPLLLPAFHIVLALILGLWGGSQVKHDIWGAHIIDHIPPAEFALHLINLPVALLVAGIFGKWSFQITPEYSTIKFVVYIILIALFWFLIGLRIASPGSSLRLQSVVMKFSSVFGMVFGGLTLLMGVVLIHSALGYVVPLTAFLWGFVILFLFGWRVVPTKNPDGWPGL